MGQKNRFTMMRTHLQLCAFDDNRSPYQGGSDRVFSLASGVMLPSVLPRCWPAESCCRLLCHVAGQRSHVAVCCATLLASGVMLPPWHKARLFAARADRPREASVMWCEDTPSVMWCEDKPSVMWCEDKPFVMWCEDKPSVMWCEDTPSAMWCEDKPSAMWCEDKPSAMWCEDTPSAMWCEDTPSAMWCEDTPSAMWCEDTLCHVV